MLIRAVQLTEKVGSVRLRLVEANVVSNHCYNFRLVIFLGNIRYFEGCPCGLQETNVR
jgi:hypothetical protein